MLRPGATDAHDPAQMLRLPVVVPWLHRWVPLRPGLNAGGKDLAANYEGACRELAETEIPLNLQSKCYFLQIPCGYTIAKNEKGIRKETTGKG